MSFDASATQLELLLERIDARLPGRESHELEFKTSANKLPDSLWETISAFANTSGGRIILGIDERENPPAIAGVSNADKLLQDFHNQMRNPQKISSIVCGPLDAFVESEAGKELIVIQVSAAPRTARPVYINGNPYAGTFVRGHTGDHRCQREEVDRMIREAHSDPPDAVIPKGYGWDDLDLEALRRYRRRFSLRNDDSPWNALSDREFLRNIGGWNLNRERGEEGPTVAGLLMFGLPLTLRDWRGRHLIDFRLLPELSRAAEWDDRLLLEGGLFEAYERISPRLTASLKTPLRFEGFDRIDDTPAHKAVREALANLLIHADYAETAPSQIFSAPDGFMFVNPGNSRVPYDELTHGRRTDPRNPNLAHMFRLLNWAEEAGSGILRIFTAWRDLGYRQPTINVGTNRYEFVLEMRHAHLIDEEDRLWLHAIDPDLREAEQLALLAARHERAVDNARLREATGLHRTDATAVLRGLKERRLLQMTGWARGAFYELGPAALKVPYHMRGAKGDKGDKGAKGDQGDQGVLGDPGRPGWSSGTSAETFPPYDLNVAGSEANVPRSNGNSGMSSARSDSNGLNSGSNKARSDSKEASSDSNDGKSVSNYGRILSVDAAEELDDAAWQRLMATAEPVRAQARVRPELMQHVILALCTQHPLTIDELCALLGRTGGALRPRLHALEAAGTLRLLYPQRNHPQQRYVAVVSDP